MTTDLTFFTNEPDAALLDRFTATLRDVQFFDVLRSNLPASLLDGSQTAGVDAAPPVEMILSEYVAVHQGGE
ncbi:MAG: hypothetical protein WA040_18435 [Anaerolineae bacterium]